jgi:ATP-binding cassette subfamily B multidrug efflux pump
MGPVRPYRAKLALGILCLFGVSACAQAVPVVLKAAIDRLGVGGDTTATIVAISSLAAVIAALAIGQAVIRIASRVLIFDVARSAEFDVRNRLFTHLLGLAPSYYRRVMTGDLMSRLTSDVQVLRQMWGPGLLNTVNSLFAYAVALPFMLQLSPALTVWALLPTPVLLAAALLFSKRLFALSRRAQEQVGRLSATTQEDLAGIGVVKTYTLEPARQATFARRSREVLDVNVALAAARGQMMPVLAALGAIGTVLVIWRGGGMIMRGEITLGTLIAFNAYVGLLLFPTLALGWTLSVFQRGAAAWRRIAELLDVQPTMVDGPGVLPRPVRGHVSVRGLTVTVPGAGSRKLLDDVSLELPEGKTIALVGPTGAGKTTLAEAVARVLEVPPGSVFLDGVDVTTVPLAAVRGEIGYAPQDAFLFSATIAQNVLHGRRGDADAGTHDALVRRAVAAAGLERDLAALPSGLDTMVGERGITLSGGQRQRVALARALASQPRVLILDDSLSSVDAHTEREILDRLATERVGRTVLLISHRPTVTAQADRIVVLDEGRVVETGTHGQLMAAGGLYATLYRERERSEAAA